MITLGINGHEVTRARSFTKGSAQPSGFLFVYLLGLSVFVVKKDGFKSIKVPFSEFHL